MAKNIEPKLKKIGDYLKLELVDIGYSSSTFKTFLFGENVKLVDSNISVRR